MQGTKPQPVVDLAEISDRCKIFERLILGCFSDLELGLFAGRGIMMLPLGGLFHVE